VSFQIDELHCCMLHRALQSDSTYISVHAGTDIIHYEQRSVWGPYRRLVHYKTKMSGFVELQPQAKHYFELATNDDGLKFNFPQPGRLEGVKTATQKFLEMEHVDFCYPGVDTNQLTDVNLKMSLSSRIVILGANGAGKTTLVKMIVGETIPSNPGQCKFYMSPFGVVFGAILLLTSLRVGEGWSSPEVWRRKDFVAVAIASFCSVGFPARAAETVGKDPNCNDSSCLGVWDGILAVREGHVGTIIVTQTDRFLNCL
jgi:ABC transporter